MSDSYRRRFVERGTILVLAAAVALGCTTSVTAPLSGTGGAATGDAGANGGGGVAGSTGGSTGAAGAGGAGAVGSAGTGGGAAGSAGGGGRGGAAGSTGTGGGIAGTTGTGGGAAGTTGAGGRGGAAGSIGGTAGTTGAGGGIAGTTGTGGGAAGTTGGGGRGGAAGTTGAGGEVILDPTPGSYQQACDGSMGVMIDATHFLDGNDEYQGMRLYTRGASGIPLETIDISAGIGLSTGDEADLEDAARIGNRVYVIGSHGRNKNGKLERARYRFFAMDVGGATPSITLTVAGYTTTLLDNMLVAANWSTPDAAVIATLTTASSLSRTPDAALAPLAGGTNIEGLAWAPTASRPNQLLIGLRNPPQAGQAIVVSLLNAGAVVGGATPQFGEATLLDLGGLGIRAMTWSPLHAAVLLVAGPHDDSAGPFRLFKWSGAAADPPIAVRDITGVPSLSAPEAIVIYPNTRDVQILFDQGDHDIDGNPCKDADASEQLFGDAIIHVP